MKLAFIIIGAVAALAFVFILLTGQKQGVQQSVGMPWQVLVHDQHHSEVFGIVLNKSRLSQAIERFNQLESIALYKNSSGQFSLEAYFGKVSIGPLSARLIANLQANQQELDQISRQTIKHTTTEDGSMKWILSSEQQLAQQKRMISALTFIPDYSGMDEVYLLQRFGQPARRKMIDENSEYWFYPEPGVRILVDTEGREVFEYTTPAQFATLAGEQQ